MGDWFGSMGSLSKLLVSVSRSSQWLSSIDWAYGSARQPVHTIHVAKKVMSLVIMLLGAAQKRLRNFIHNDTRDTLNKVTK